VAPANPLTQLLHNVLTSRVYDVAKETPLEVGQRLSRRLRNEVLLKREDLQRSSASSCVAPTTRSRT
jgi:threonine dehydratase